MAKNNMSQGFLKNNKNFMLFLAFIAVVLIVYSMPKNRLRHYEFSQGKPWTYNELIAPFSFSIEKSEEDLKNEIDSLRDNFSPYFSYDTAVAKRVISGFESLYTNTLRHKISINTYVALRTRLQDIYKGGIISSDAEGLLGNSKASHLRIYSGNSSSFLSIKSVRNEKTAYQYLTSVDMPDNDRYYLLQFNLEDFIQPNMVYDITKSKADLTAQENQISQYKGMVVADQKIIDHGEIIDANTYQIIKSYVKVITAKTESKRFQLFTWTGQFLLVSLLLTLLYFYLLIYRADNIDSRSKLIFIFGSITLFTIVTCLYVEYATWSIFILPSAMLAVLFHIFLDSRTAFISYLIHILICSVVIQMSFEFVLLQSVAGLTGIYSLRELSQRSQLLRTTLLIFLSYCIIWTSMQLMQIESIKEIDYMMYIMFAINCVLLLLIYPLLFIIEKSFEFTSNVTLIELSNFNQPLLRELAENAPGTFQHSIQVSTLAAEAANRVGASAQLVRTAALYHDIGKLVNPPFFVENQNGTNPHEKLKPEESAGVIIRHVDEGLKLADKYGLPDAIRDFIVTHHGSGIAKYFYVRYQQNNPNVVADPSRFRYTGTNPTTKETAILMMADSVEAASRSLIEYTEESIGTLVDKIIDTQLSEGFFKDSPLTFKEIVEIKEVFKEKLKTMYHTRISYPELKPETDMERFKRGPRRRRY